VLCQQHCHILLAHAAQQTGQSVEWLIQNIKHSMGEFADLTGKIYVCACDLRETARGQKEKLVFADAVLC